MSNIPPGIPLESQDAYQRYLAMPLISKSILSQQIKDYIDAIGSTSGENACADIELAQSLGDSLLKLLEFSTDTQLSRTQAACVYFMEDDDATPDFGSVLGFEDDALVFNAVCKELGYPELEVEL